MNAREYLGFSGGITVYPAKDLKNRIAELIEFVKRKEAASRRIGGYSRGMKCSHIRMGFIPPGSF